MKYRSRILIAGSLANLLLAAMTGVALAQTPTGDPTLTNTDLLVKIIGGVIAGLVALIGIPLGFLTYKKTQAEIRKLELEAQSLEHQIPTSSRTRTASNGVNVAVDNSPNAIINVLADPRFLIPLLLLTDFVFAWIALTLAGHLLSIFELGGLGDLLMVFLAGVLLLPIGRQAMRVRSVLRPVSDQERQRLLSRARTITFGAVFLAAAALIFIGGCLLLFNQSNLTGVGYYFAYALVALGVTIGALTALGRRRIDGYLKSLY
jgi:hypothetical protein